MKSREAKIAPQSDYYVYTPSLTAKQLFFYPLRCGHFIYEPDYTLSRETFDSFLLMYVEQGNITVKSGDFCGELSSGQFLFLDCYKPHSYSTAKGCECFWCHFDGVMARGYYEMATQHTGSILTIKDPFKGRGKLKAVYDIFNEGAPVREPLVSKYLNDLLTCFLLNTSQKENPWGRASISEEAAAYIRENFAKDLPVEELAAHAGLSTWHFIRVFKQEIGLTPHQYLVNTRIAAAKYLLKNSPLPTKNICYETGFSCESVFCSAFKKHEGMTPLEYRGS